MPEETNSDNLAEAFPLLDEAFPPLDLPVGVVQNADGSIHVPFDHPFDLAWRGPDGHQKSEHFDHLTLRRLTGREVLKMLAATRSTSFGLSYSSGLSLAKLALVTGNADASDITRASEVVAELLGGMGANLPDHAEEIEGGIVLKLRQPVSDGEGIVHRSLTFHRMKAADVEAMAKGRDMLQVGVHRATGLTMKALKVMLPAMDGADVIDTSRVVGFLTRAGRKSGQ